MTIDQLRKAVRNQPFHPFSICLADGRQLPVSHPEFIAIPPDASRTFVIAGPNEDYKTIDLLLVASLDFRNGNAQPTPKQQE